MSQPTPPPNALTPADAELLELYLDGQLSGDRAAQAEVRISQVPAMQTAVTQQERIDNSLKQQFESPAVSDAFLQQLLSTKQAGQESEASPVEEAPLVEEASPKVVLRTDDDVRRQRRTQLLAVAATLACVSLWGTYGLDQLKQLWQPNEGYAKLTVAQVYREAVQSGFEPDWLCEDDQQFAQTFADRQGQGLLLEPLPEGVRMAGLAYLKGFARKATSMFAYVENEPVLVMVGRTESVSESLLKADEELGISVFTRRLGELTLVEVTPFDTPRVLSSLRLAEVPAKPTGHVPGAPWTE